MPSSSAVFPFLGRNYVPSLTEVPDEILAEFFLAYLSCEKEGWQTETAGGNEEIWETVGRNRHPSVDLSHVCRRWRRVALGTPRLWVQAEIYVPSFPDSRDRIPKLTDMVRTLTHRSGVCTMSFTLRLMPRDKGCSMGAAPIEPTVPFKESIQKFVDAVCLSSARWRRFSLAGNETYDIPIMKFVDALAAPLPALNYIHLDTNFTTLLPTGLICPLIDTPALQSVTVLQPYGRLDNLPVKDWSNLKSLTLGSWKKAGLGFGMHPRTALHLLKSLNSLIHLDVHMDDIAQTTGKRKNTHPFHFHTFSRYR